MRSFRFTLLSPNSYICCSIFFVVFYVQSMMDARDDWYCCCCSFVSISIAAWILNRIKSKRFKLFPLQFPIIFFANCISVFSHRDQLQLTILVFYRFLCYHFVFGATTDIFCSSPISFVLWCEIRDLSFGTGSGAAAGW